MFENIGLYIIASIDKKEIGRLYDLLEYKQAHLTAIRSGMEVVSEPYEGQYVDIVEVILPDTSRAKLIPGLSQNED